MRKLVVAMAALGVLAGGGAGAYFYLKKPAEAALPEKHKTEENHAAKKGEHGEGVAELAPTFVEMDPVVVPVMDGDGISQTISMMITLEVEDPEKAQKVENLKPRIKDAMIISLYGLMNHPAVMEKGALRVDYVKKRLSDATQKVMGDAGVKDVLLQMVQQNPL